MQPNLPLFALTLSLLIGACTGKHAAQTTGASHDSVPAGDEPVAAAQTMAAEPKLDAWKAVAPLIVGSYTGSCSKLDGHELVERTMVVGADGKASAEGVQADFRLPAGVSISRHPEEKYGVSTTVGLNAGPDKADGELLLSHFTNGTIAMANLTRGPATGLICAGEVTGGAKMSSLPLFETVSHIVDVRKQTLSCTSPENRIDGKNVDAEVHGNVITVAGEPYDTGAAISQQYKIDDGALDIDIRFSDDRNLSFSYSRYGKLNRLTISRKTVTTHTCVSDGR